MLDREMRTQELTRVINDSFPNLILEFVEYNQNTNQGYGIDLKVKAIKFIEKTQVVIEGQLTIANKPFGKGTIEHQFNTGEFYRVSYSDKTKRTKKLHKLILHNVSQGQKLLSFISNYLNSQDND